MIKLKDLLPEGIQDKGILKGVFLAVAQVVVKLMCQTNIWYT